MKFFGTDGIRGKFGIYPINEEFAFKLGRSFTSLCGKGSIVVGRDTRSSAITLEKAIVEGINSLGSSTTQLGVIPSNAVSFYVKKLKAVGGIMISASHNPADENGFKFFWNNGCKLTNELEEKFEKIIDQDSINSNGMPTNITIDSPTDYLEMIKNSLEGNNLSGLKVAIDAGNGSASRIAIDLFTSLSCNHSILGVNPDGTNINSSGAMNPSSLCKIVVDKNLDAGIAFDGDADRLVLVDEKGNILSGDSIMYIEAVHLNSIGKLNSSTLVATNFSNLGLDKSLEEKNIKVLRTDVGDKNVSIKLMQQALSFGGENSGHLIFPNHALSADALLSGIQLLFALKQSGKKLSELNTINLLPSKLINIKVKEKIPLGELKSNKFIEESKILLKNSGRVLVRYSGTEKVMRVLVEATNQRLADKIANTISNAINEEIGL